VRQLSGSWRHLPTSYGARSRDVGRINIILVLLRLVTLEAERKAPNDDRPRRQPSTGLGASAWLATSTSGHGSQCCRPGRWPMREVDHRNGDPPDDRWRNLREATHSQMVANRGVQRNNMTSLKRVRPSKNGFVAKIKKDGKMNLCRLLLHPRGSTRSVLRDGTPTPRRVREVRVI
jgi:HNH endonuclease